MCVSHLVSRRALGDCRGEILATWVVRDIGRTIDRLIAQSPHVWYNIIYTSAVVGVCKSRFLAMSVYISDCLSTNVTQLSSWIHRLSLNYNKHSEIAHWHYPAVVIIPTKILNPDHQQNRKVCCQQDSPPLNIYIFHTNSSIISWAISSIL